MKRKLKRWERMQLNRFKYFTITFGSPPAPLHIKTIAYSKDMTDDW